MGVLDDAIREHLELKRKHGAPEVDIAREEAEALGPARREPAAGASGAPSSLDEGHAASDLERTQLLSGPASEPPPPPPPGYEPPASAGVPPPPPGVASAPPATPFDAHGGDTPAGAAAMPDTPALSSEAQPAHGETQAFDVFAHDSLEDDVPLPPPLEAHHDESLPDASDTALPPLGSETTHLHPEDSHLHPDPQHLHPEDSHLHPGPHLHPEGPDLPAHEPAEPAERILPPLDESDPLALPPRHEHHDLDEPPNPAVGSRSPTGHEEPARFEPTLEQEPLLAGDHEAPGEADPLAPPTRLHEPPAGPEGDTTAPGREPGAGSHSETDPPKPRNSLDFDH
ncbi:MAG: hypothetical protein NVS2B6_06800 [Thermoleophilaceae bacterium]